MKKVLFCLFFVLILIGNSYAQNGYHVVEGISVSDNSTSTDAMTTKIKDAAIKYQAYAPVPRIAQFDFAFGSDLSEYKKLNGFGILYIASLNQDLSEYPIERVYFKYKDGIIDLKLIGSVKVSITNTLIKKVFGSNRNDYYYYFPYIITQLTGQLMIDWKTNRKEFKICDFPSDSKLDYIKDEKLLLPVDKKNIDLVTFDSFAQREFQIKLNK